MGGGVRMNLLASAVKSATYDEILDLAGYVTSEVGDVDRVGPGASGGGAPYLSEVAEAISSWADRILASEGKQ